VCVCVCACACVCACVCVCVCVGTEELTVKEWYQHRDDRLEEVEVNKVDGFTIERFKRGRRFHLLRKY